MYALPTRSVGFSNLEIGTIDAVPLFRVIKVADYPIDFLVLFARVGHGQVAAIAAGDPKH